MAETGTAHQAEIKVVEKDIGEGGILKSLGSAATICVAVLYGVGLLVTNAYLLSIGVTDFNLFRVRCVLTGGWATPLVIAIFLPAVLTIQALADGKKKKSDASIIFAISVLASIFAWVLLLACGVIPTLRLATYHLAGIGLASIPAASYAFLYFVKKHDKRQGIKPGPPNAMLFFALMFMCVIGVTAGVGKYAYPSVTAGFGGGKPQRAKLILNHEGVATWSKLPGSINYDALAKAAGSISSVPNSDPVLTPEVEIIYENDNQLVIRWNLRDQNSVVMLDRKLISAVIPTERQM